MSTGNSSSSSLGVGDPLWDALSEKTHAFCSLAVERGYCSFDQLTQILKARPQENGSWPLKDFAAYVSKTGVLNKQQALACEQAIMGQTIVANFEVLEKIGQGGMGAVYRARQISMDRSVALKILHPRLAQDPTFKKRFLHEARISAKLSHLNIINGIDCGEAGGCTAGGTWSQAETAGAGGYEAARPSSHSCETASSRSRETPGDAQGTAFGRAAGRGRTA